MTLPSQEGNKMTKTALKWFIFGLALIAMVVLPSCKPTNYLVMQQGGKTDYIVIDNGDDETFQHALDALPKDGGIIYTLAGTYKFLSPVSRNIDNVFIIGDGNDSTIFESDNLDTLFIASGNGWIFRDITIITNNGQGINMGDTQNWAWYSVTINGIYYQYKRGERVSSESVMDAARRVQRITRRIGR